MNTALKLLRVKNISDKTTWAESTVWLKVARGEFIPPVKIGGIAFWKESDVDDWIENQFAKSEMGAA
jgi:predicted DNA-binding transcriptional regulator AlpA